MSQQTSSAARPSRPVPRTMTSRQPQARMLQFAAFDAMTRGQQTFPFPAALPTNMIVGAHIAQVGAPRIMYGPQPAEPGPAAPNQTATIRRRAVPFAWAEGGAAGGRQNLYRMPRMLRRGLDARMDRALFSSAMADDAAFVQLHLREHRNTYNRLDATPADFGPPSFPPNSQMRMSLERRPHLLVVRPHRETRSTQLSIQPTQSGGDEAVRVRIRPVSPVEESLPIPASHWRSNGSEAVERHEGDGRRNPSQSATMFYNEIMNQPARFPEPDESPADMRTFLHRDYGQTMRRPIALRPRPQSGLGIRRRPRNNQSAQSDT